MIFLCLIILVTASGTHSQSENEVNVTTRHQPKQLQNEDNPCNCYFRDSCGCICSRPITWSQFQILPQNFRPCRAFTLALRGGQFFAFPSDYFYRVGHVQDYVLDVGNVAFQYLNDPEGESSPYNGINFDVSAYLRMYGVSVNRQWNWGALYWLAPTSQSAYCEVQVVQSTVPHLQADFGRICQGVVTVVNIMYSGLSVIDDRAFEPFYKLVEVNLGHNRLREMRRSYFPLPANMLETINLEYNQIRTLPNDMFSQMPSLRSVNLRGNPVSTLDERTFRSIFRTVEIMGLDTLPFSCDCILVG